MNTKSSPSRPPRRVREKQKRKETTEPQWAIFLVFEQTNGIITTTKRFNTRQEALLELKQMKKLVNPTRSYLARLKD